MTEPDITRPKRTLGQFLARARVLDRYATYDLAEAERRLALRQAARRRCTVHGGGQGPAEQRAGAWLPTAWTKPDAADIEDAERARWDLEAVSLVVLYEPKAGTRLEDFIQADYTDRTGARVFACLLHLAGHRDGARFWWQFAAGAGDYAAEYCLFLDHARRGEYQDADHWSGQLRDHGFAPDEHWGDRASVPLIIDDAPAVAARITEQVDPDLGPVPLPQPDLVEGFRELTSAASRLN
ncbi:hypothetical protein [Streptomyces sp. NPDC001380]|uniref:hypothetical protein n=1 Tax=Streptomyces sp. NPDC001380 TaxID=3364566 RepID=UPI0036BDD4F7